MKYDYTLELTCDKCGKTKKWRNEIDEFSRNSNMKANVDKAKSQGWSIVKHSCKCPKCKVRK